MYSAQNFKLDKEYANFEPKLIWAWNVSADDGYEYTRSEEDKDFYPSKTLVLLRIIRGKMTLECRTCRICLNEGELVLIPLKEIVKYSAESKTLNYYWYNFTVNSIPYLKPNRVYSLAIIEKEINLYGEMRVAADMTFNFGEYMANLKFTELLTDYIIRLSDNSTAIISGADALIKTIQEEYGKEISLKIIAEKNNISERSLRNHFNKYVGMSPKQYQFKVRMQKAEEYLGFPSLSVNNVAEKLGYGMSVHFSRDFKKYFGFSPSEYRKKLGCKYDEVKNSEQNDGN